jgi:menaquinol-cytochrome c reductase iron-sulfur subunit
MSELLTRRAFLNKISIAGSAAAGIVISVPIIAYLLSPLLNRDARPWQRIGPVDDYEVGQTVQIDLQDPSPLPWAGRTALMSGWLRRTETGFICFSVHCTHLGCPVNWLAKGQIFLCPCHGGVFNADGQPVGGPPQRPLQRHDVRVQDGFVEVRPVALKVR